MSLPVTDDEHRSEPRIVWLAVDSEPSVGGESSLKNQNQGTGIFCGIFFAVECAHFLIFRGAPI
jgi:hypothetical protein